MTDVVGLDKLPVLLDIAQKAIEADSLDREARERNRDLLEEYAGFKESLGIDYVERGSREWDGMVQATKPEYEAMKNAKRLAVNAQRRLKTAVRRYYPDHQ